MTKLLEIKDQLIRFYSKYETYLYPIVKFAVALALFTVINTNIGFRTDFVCDSVLCIFSFRTERRTDGCAYTAVF